MDRLSRFIPEVGGPRIRRVSLLCPLCGRHHIFEIYENDTVELSPSVSKCPVKGLWYSDEELKKLDLEAKKLWGKA